MDFLLPESDGLKIEYFGHLFDNTSECYKMFWFQVIIEKILAGQTSASYEDIIDEMISDAWYMVAEYHLNFEPRDNQEYAIGYYAKERFKVVSEPFMEDGIPHVRMEKEIE